MGIRNSGGRCRPVRRNEAPDGIAVVACTEVVAAGFGVAFFAGEVVVVGDAKVSDYALATEGIVIRFFFDVPQGVGHYIRRAQVIAKVERVSACRVITGCALAAEEDVFVRQSTAQVGLFQHLTARAMPVQGVRASRLLYPLSGSVVVIVAGDAAHRSLGEPILAVIVILLRSMFIVLGRAA